MPRPLLDALRQLVEPEPGEPPASDTSTQLFSAGATRVAGQASPRAPAGAEADTAPGDRDEPPTRIFNRVEGDTTRGGPSTPSTRLVGGRGIVLRQLPKDARRWIEDAALARSATKAGHVDRAALPGLLLKAAEHPAGMLGLLASQGSVAGEQVEVLRAGLRVLRTVCAVCLSVLAAGAPCACAPEPPA